MSEQFNFECVLPVSGKFARIRKIRWEDVLLAYTAGPLFFAALATRVATIDGEALQLSDWVTMDLEEAAPVANELLRRMAVMNNAKGVG